MMKAYHGDENIKQLYVNRMQAHIDADELIRGTGFIEKTGKGCAVGCTLNKYDHTAYQTELGLPEWLARTEDAIFEGMSEEKSKDFPLLFLKAINAGVDYSTMFKPWLIVICESVLEYVADSKFKQQRDAILLVVDVLKNGGDIKAAWAAVETAARAATGAAVRAATGAAVRAATGAAVRAAVETAAWAAAGAAAGAAAQAAWDTGAAVETAAWVAAGAEKYDYFADELLKMLRSWE